MGKLSFVSQYVTKPRSVGAFLPSSKYLASKMVERINFDEAKCIIEYGAGTGIFTEKILKMRKPGTVVFVFEMNETFCKELTERFGHEPDLYIHNETAEYTALRLAGHRIQSADYIVSGLPFASMPPDVSERILRQTQICLRPGGMFITFQYTLLKKGLIQRFFENVEVEREVKNVPPAYILYCTH